MSLRELMKEHALGSTFQRMSVVTLKKAIEKAKSTGDTHLKRGSSDASLGALEDILSQVEHAVAKPSADTSLHDAVISSNSMKLRTASTRKRKVENAAPRKGKEMRIYFSAGSKDVALIERVDYTTAEEYNDSRKRVTDAQAQARREQARKANKLRAKKMRKEKRLEAARKATLVASKDGVVSAGERLQASTSTNPGNSEHTGDTVEEVIPRSRSESMESSPEAVELAEDGESVELGSSGEESSEDSEKEPAESQPDSAEHYSERRDELTDEQKDEIKALIKRCPPFLYHVHSNKGRRHTRGSASSRNMTPAAFVDDRPLYNSINDFPTLSELVSNFGYRILWNIRKADQFSSYSTSLLFAFVHALGRRTRGETDIYISIIDTRLAKTVNGEPAEFYYVPELQRILDMADWKGWGDMQMCKLIAPWYSHEYVAHGVVDLGASVYRMVPFDEFIAHGLFDFARSLYCEGEEREMKKLYLRCVQLRVTWHALPDPVPFDIGYLDEVAKFARLFYPAASGVTNSGSDTIVQFSHIPVNLQVFLDLVGLSKRPRNDAVFLEYIRSHFSANDAQGLLHANMTHLPGNLPEKMQALDRYRDVCTALNLPGPGKKNAISLVDANFDFNGKWHGRLRDIVTQVKEARKKNAVGPEKSVEKRNIEEDAVVERLLHEDIVEAVGERGDKTRPVGETTGATDNGNSRERRENVEVEEEDEDEGERNDEDGSGHLGHRGESVTPEDMLSISGGA